MKFAKPAELSYWSAGGGVTSRFGPVSLERANDLYSFYAALAASCDNAADRDGARWCATLAIQMYQAISQTERWRRCASPKSTVGIVRAG